MTWKGYKLKLKNHIVSTHNIGLATETIILDNGFGVSKYDSKKKKQEILDRTLCQK